MPSIKFTDETPEGKKRTAQIEKVLPKTPIVVVPETVGDINDKILKVSKKQAIEMLKQEIEVYKAFPKKGKYNPDTFTPRNSRQCFMGQGFTANGHGFEGWTDWELKQYRQSVGTIHHEEWGNVTLLEIWGGDHFEKWPKMVKDVFLYCWGDKDKLPRITFHINPFNKNDKSGTWDPDPDELYQKENREHLLKIAHYCEIRDRMKAAGVKNPMDLALRPEDDPKKPTKSRR